MTLYVESNFVLELALGQEELPAAERLIAAAEAGAVTLALPSFSLSEPFSRVTRGIRDRRRLWNQLNSHVDQLARLSPHQAEAEELQGVSELFAQIDQRETDHLLVTVERLLGIATIIDINLRIFLASRHYRSQYGLDSQDAIILASVVTDLRTRSGSSPSEHVFANRNRKDFGDPELRAELQRLGCRLVWSLEEAANLLRVP